MDRNATLEYLQREYAELVDDLQMDETTLIDAYSNVVDAALRKLGYAETGLLSADESGDAYLALLNFYVLRRFVRALATRVDTNVNGALSLSRSQGYKQVKALADEAAVECAALGYPVDGAGHAQAMSVGRFNLDFLEPSCSSGGEF
jgi:hypothetical protein